MWKLVLEQFDDMLVKVSLTLSKQAILKPMHDSCLPVVGVHNSLQCWQSHPSSGLQQSLLSWQFRSLVCFQKLFLAAEPSLKRQPFQHSNAPRACRCSC